MFCFSDVSTLMEIANTEISTAPSERPIKCPLCQNIIKHARNLRRHVFKRHLPSAQRGDFSEHIVKSVLENKIKSLTVTPLTDDELREVQQRIRRKGFKPTRSKKRGIGALPNEVNSSSIDENEVTIRKLPSKKEKKAQALSMVIPSNFASLAMSSSSQEGAIDLAVSQEPSFSSLSMVVPQVNAPQTAQAPAHPVTLSVPQPGVQPRLATDSSGQSRLQTESLNMSRDLMHPMSFDPHLETSSYPPNSSNTQVAPVASTTASSSYIPGCYWMSSPVPSIPGASFQAHQPVFASAAQAEYFHLSQKNIAGMQFRKRGY